MAIHDAVIAVDFDGTVVTHEYPHVGEDAGAVPVLRELTDNGCRLILCTMRSGRLLDKALAWFAERDIPLYAVNENPEQHRWTQSPKIHADLYIDDSALGCPIRFIDGVKRPVADWVKSARSWSARAISTDRRTHAHSPHARHPYARHLRACPPHARHPHARRPHHPPPWQGAPGTDTKQRVHPPTGGWTLSSDVRQSAAVCAVVSGHCCRSLHQPFPVPAADPYLRPPCPAVNSGPCFRRLFRPQHQPLRSLLPAVISVHSSRPPTSAAAAGRYFQRLRGYLPSAIIRSMLAISAGLSSL